MTIWDVVCSDDSKHSWTRQSITRICLWCGGKATSSGVGVYSGLCQWSDVEYMAEANVEIGFSVTEIPVYCKVCLVKLSWDYTWWNLVCTFCHDLDKKFHTFEDVAMKYWKYASLQDYMKESDNLVSLHAKIRECDTILTHMESLLGGFQVRWRCKQ
jgi:hypothetical protein